MLYFRVKFGYHKIQSLTRKTFVSGSLGELHVSAFTERAVAVNMYCKANNIIEPPHDKTNRTTCAPSEDSDQPGHPPSLIRVLAVRIKKGWVLNYP